MVSYLIAFLGFIFVFGLVVFVHEFGHFTVAKWYNVQVDSFSMGMGPALTTWQIGETQYRIGILPLGGYVSLAGEDPGEAEDNPRAFFNKSVWARTAVLLAGGLCNLLLGYVIYLAVGMFQGEEINPPKIGFVARDMPAHRNLQVGDRILRINGYKVDSFQDVFVRNELLGDTTREFVVRRDQETLTVHIDPKRIEREGFLNQPSYVVGIAPYAPPRVGTLDPEGAGRELGFREGDRIVTFGDTPVRSWNEFTHNLQTHEGNWTVRVRRDGREVPVTLRIPAERQEWQQWVQSLGIRPPVEIRRYGPLESFAFAYRRLIRDVNLMFEGFYRLVVGQVSPQSLAGPVGIITLTGQMAMVGFWPLLRFTAFFSVNLGILNLLPIPVLDGGHIFLSIPEMVTGRPLPESVIGMANRIGLIFLLSLLIFVTFFDLKRFQFLETFFQYVGLD